MNGQMLGLSRLAYSLATNRQIPSAIGRLHPRRGTPYVVITAAALIAFGLALPNDMDFLAGIFAFGAMLTFAIAHMSVIALRFREAGRPSAFRLPLSFRFRKGTVPLPAVVGALFSLAAWVSIIGRARGRARGRRRVDADRRRPSTRSTGAGRASPCGSASRSRPRRSRT